MFAGQSPSCFHMPRLCTRFCPLGSYGTSWHIRKSKICDTNSKAILQ